MRMRSSTTVWAVLATVAAAALGVALGEGLQTPGAPGPLASATPSVPPAQHSAAAKAHASAANTAGAQAAPCGASPQANPFAAQTPCTAVRAAPATLPSALPELQQALDSVDPCAGQRSGCRRSAHPFEVTLVRQLETLALADTGATRVALALQLQRQRLREGLQASDSMQVAQDADLQRSVALLAEAVAVGDPQALRYRDSLGEDGARLLHTGR